MKERWLVLLAYAIAGTAAAEPPPAPYFSDLLVLPDPAAVNEIVALQGVKACGGSTFFRPNVVIDGSIVNVHITYAPCTGSTPASFQVALGRFAPGSYTMRLIGHPCCFDPPFNSPPIDVPFTVEGGSTAMVAPTAGMPALFALAAMLAVVAGSVLRRPIGRRH
jgi:hypothetical protein